MPIRGLDKHRRRLARLAGPELEREIGRALFAGAEIVRTEAQLSITAGSVSGKGHTPSAPGQPPQNDTGVLANNIEATLEHRAEGPVAIVASNAPYSASLEFGTSPMAARPFMAPAREATRRDVERLVAKAVDRLSKRG